jgi:circadian clock protein KaiB
MTAVEPSHGALTLYVNGASELSARAIADATALCDAHLDGRYHLAIVDVHENPALVVKSEVIATPTLVRNLPLPELRLVGDLSDANRVLQALELPASVPLV